MPLSNTRNVWCVGKMIDDLDTAKPPTKKQILQRFFKLHLVEKCSISKSARIIAKSLRDLWNPNQELCNISRKIIILHSKWAKLCKGKYKKTKLEIKKRKDFVNDLKSAFCNIGQPLTKSQPTNKVQKTKSEPFEKEDISSVDSDDSDVSVYERSKNIVQKEIFTLPKKSKLCASLDRTGISCRKASLILNSYADSGQSNAKAACSKSSIWRERKKQRLIVADSIKKSFVASNYNTVHWDGKIMPDLKNKRNKNDRLSISVTGNSDLSFWE